VLRGVAVCCGWLNISVRFVRLLEFVRLLHRLIHIHKYIYIYIHVYMYMGIQTCVYMFVFIHICVHYSIYVNAHTNIIYEYILLNIYTRSDYISRWFDGLPTNAQQPSMNGMHLQHKNTMRVCVRAYTQYYLFANKHTYKTIYEDMILNIYP